MVKLEHFIRDQSLKQQLYSLLFFKSERKLCFSYKIRKNTNNQYTVHVLAARNLKIENRYCDRWENCLLIFR